MKLRSGWGRALGLALIALLALAPAACGKKGSPKLPPPQTDTYPNQYPQSTDPQQGIFN